MEYTKYTVAVGMRLKDRLYLSQRVKTVNFDGKWQFAGGKLEHQENPVDGALRELNEETNLNVHPGRIRFVGPIKGDPSTDTCYVYYVDLHSGEIPVRTENGMTDWKLFDYEEALKLDLMPGLKETIQKIRNL